MLVELNGSRVFMQWFLMASESSTTPRQTLMNSRHSPSPPCLQLPSGEVSEILQQMCAEISQTTTAEMVEVANSATFQSKLQELMLVYFYSSSQLQSPEAVIICLLLKQWRDNSERRQDRRAFQENNEWLRGRVAEMERKLYESRNEVHRVTAELGESEPEINRLTTQVQDLTLQNDKLQYEVSVIIIYMVSSITGFFS